MPDADSRCYGTLIELPPADVEALYSPRDVRDYRPERVAVELLDDGVTRPATVYVLPADEVSETSNPEYAAKLAALARELGLPEAYAADIAAFEQ